MECRLAELNILAPDCQPPSDGTCVESDIIKDVCFFKKRGFEETEKIYATG